MGTSTQTDSALDAIEHARSGRKNTSLGGSGLAGRALVLDRRANSMTRRDVLASVTAPVNAVPNLTADLLLFDIHCCKLGIELVLLALECFNRASPAKGAGGQAVQPQLPVTKLDTQREAYTDAEAGVSDSLAFDDFHHLRVRYDRGDHARISSHPTHIQPETTADSPVDSHACSPRQLWQTWPHRWPSSFRRPRTGPHRCRPWSCHSPAQPGPRRNPSARQRWLWRTPPPARQARSGAGRWRPVPELWSNQFGRSDGNDSEEAARARGSARPSSNTGTHSPVVAPGRVREPTLRAAASSSSASSCSFV